MVSGIEQRTQCRNGGLNAFSFPDILAWTTLTKRTLDVWEVGLLKKLDSLYLNAQQEKATVRHLKAK